MATVLARINTLAERDALLGWAGHAHLVQFYRDESHFMSAIQQNTADAIVRELSGADAAFVRTPYDAPSTGRRSLPIVLRFSMTPGSIGHLLHELRRSEAVHLSLSHEPIAELLDSLIADPLGRDAAPAILARTGPKVPYRAIAILVGAITLGRQRCSVRCLATACGLPTRTLEWRLKTSGMLPARCLLGWCTSLHSAWRMDVLGWSAKRAAAVAGFASSATFSSYTFRHVGILPTRLNRSGGYAALLERFSEECVALGSP